MSKKLLSSFCVLAGVAAAASSAQAQTNDGTIYITGQVTASTCTITGTNNEDVYVYLDNVPASAFSGINTFAGAKPFTIRLTGCSPSTGNVHTRFMPGANTNVVTNRLNNAATGGSNADIQIVNGDDTSVLVGKPDGAQNSKPVALTGGAADLTYKARYYAASFPVTNGTVETSVPYMIVYP